MSTLVMTSFKLYLYLEQYSVGPLDGVVRSRVKHNRKFLVKGLLLVLQDSCQLVQTVVDKSGLSSFVGNLGRMPSFNT